MISAREALARTNQAVTDRMAKEAEAKRLAGIAYRKRVEIELTRIPAYLADLEDMVKVAAAKGANQQVKQLTHELLPETVQELSKKLRALGYTVGIWNMASGRSGYDSTISLSWLV